MLCDKILVIDKKCLSIDFIVPAVYLAKNNGLKNADLYNPGEMGFS